ncbi:HEAT repeat domain-containing protein [Kitasatospora viridis]|uniref:HEAT repeat protein n=1 Tax=Kitasatospora viridis TaxID=281105 RepID=A0A561SEL5_9ACTN|nr:HEAT repeat domain-containing protein [Kitasatospora viridis]TWF73287.1 HEAT repeat protein [Kitasatospora viridis]
MDKRLLIEQLSDGYNQTRPARDALVAQGAAVVGAVLELLCDERAGVDWSVSADVLQRIGEPALLPLAEAAAGAGSAEVTRRIGYALGRLKVADLAAYLPLLEHPHAEVRSTALFAFQTREEEAAGFVERLLPLLGDPDPEVRQRAVWTFEAIGSAAVPALRAVRERPATGPRIRRGALQALAGAARPGELGDRDLAAWRRLTRIKLADEVPSGLHLCGSWYALPTTDQAAVLDAFDLGDAEPVTLRTGAAAWNQAQHSWSGRRPHTGCARVFVSPALAGWTLVFGDSAAATHRIRDREEARDQVVRERCAELGRRFGAAQWYGMSCGDGWTAWCIATGGEVVRHYDVFAAEEDDDPLGPPHPAESGFLLPHEDGFPDDAFDGVNLSDNAAFRARYDQVKEELGIPDTCYATDIAARLSVDPSALGPDTPVTGHGLLALTACGREHGHPSGALPA